MSTSARRRRKGSSSTSRTSPRSRGESRLRVRPHEADELSHYSSETSDIEYLFPIGWSELEGIANRSDFDLTQHTAASGTKLEWVDASSGERYTPHVIEPAL